MSDSQAAMLETKIDPVEWKRELERVGPRLKVRTGVTGFAIRHPRCPHRWNGCGGSGGIGYCTFIIPLTSVS